MLLSATNAPASTVTNLPLVDFAAASSAVLFGLASTLVTAATAPGSAGHSACCW
ncbi:hypothetical protein ACWEIJ_44050 [Lentzea sp. NPDC004789]